MPISQIPSRLAPHRAATGGGIPLFHNAHIRCRGGATAARKLSANHEKQKNERTNPIPPNPNYAMLVQRNFASIPGAIDVKPPSISPAGRNPFLPAPTPIFWRRERVPAAASNEKQKNERTNPISPNPNSPMLVQRNFAVLGACPRAPRRKRSFASTFGAVAIKHPSICAWRPARRGRNALVHHNSGDKSELSSFPMNRTQDKVFQGPHLTMSRGGSIITADEWPQQESGTGGMTPYYLQPKDKPIRPSIINGNKAKGLLRDQDTRME